MSLVRIQHAITGEVADVEQEAFDTVWSGKQWTIVPGATNLGDAFVTQWKPKTSYKAGEWVVNPSGELVSTIADFQSGVSYDATKFGPTAQSNTYAQKQANTIALFGHSFCAQTGLLNGENDAGVATANVRRYDAIGHWSWAAVNLGHRVTLLKNAGVAGNNTVNLLARMTDITALNPMPSFVLLDIGINDVNNDWSVATITANMQSIITQLLAAGPVVAVATICPSSLITSAPRLPILHAVNDWIRNYANSTPGCVLVDWAAAVTDPASATGQWLASFTTDLTHSNATGAAAMGKVLADALSPLVSGSRVRNSSVGDPKNLIVSNPRFQSTGAASATGITGTWATFWNTDLLSNVGTVVASVVNRTDGQPGKMEQFVISATAQVRVYQVQTAGKGTTWDVGDRIYAECEFEADADWVNCQLLQLNMYCGGAGNLVQGLELANATWTTLPLGVYPRSGVLRTPIVKIDPAAVSLFPQFQWKADAGTIRIGPIVVRKV